MGYQIEPVDEIRDKIASVRISKILDYITQTNPTLIPFRIKFPILNELDYKSFSELILKYDMYEELPQFIKDKVEKAEKVKYFDIKFKKYLQIKNMTEEQFSSLTPEDKLDVFYDFMFENKLDIGMLD